ncbi:MAG: hypothetical protein ACOCVF_04325 [bacterium]
MKLTGILHNFPSSTKSGRIYPKEVFDKAFEEYIRKENIRNRKRKIEKLIKNLANR